MGETNREHVPTSLPVEGSSEKLKSDELSSKSLPVAEGVTFVLPFAFCFAGGLDRATAVGTLNPSALAFDSDLSRFLSGKR